jgi:hypothetical protein
MRTYANFETHDISLSGQISNPDTLGYNLMQELLNNYPRIFLGGQKIPIGFVLSRCGWLLGCVPEISATGFQMNLSLVEMISHTYFADQNMPLSQLGSMKVTSN